MRPLLFLVLTVTVSLLSPLFAVNQNAGHHSADLTVTKVIADERIYLPNEVDKEAVLKNLDKVLSEFQLSLTCPGEETITLSIVLHKSAKVTKVKIETEHGCKMPDNVLATFQKIIFAPAVKNNAPVSQLLEIQMRLVANSG